MDNTKLNQAATCTINIATITLVYAIIGASTTMLYECGVMIAIMGGLLYFIDAREQKKSNNNECEINE